MAVKTKIDGFLIRKAEKTDVPLVLDFIGKLAEYENLSHEVIATEAQLERYLFGEEKVAEVVIGFYRDVPVGFALYFFNFSTFLAKPGIYLEDLYVLEQFRGKGFGKLLLTYLARLAMEKNCGRLEWAVLDWNEPSIAFYKSLGAKTMNQWIINRVTGESLEKLADQF
ncbi:MAG: GNAT family N-acetyltransferase [Candidatus Aminicenantes bacterium]|nr:MAG: GNAT family N-acetyltransferase [Candidatus Aminicenantes bacterium]